MTMQSGDYPQSASNPYVAQPVNQPPKEKNTLGLIALICAVLGLIFSCVKGALIIGWILLPISFILALVAMFGGNKKRGTAIAALIVSIIGTVVAAVFFLFVVGEAFDDSFNQETNAIAPDGTRSEGGDGPGTTRENPLPLGSTIEGADWAVTINSVDLNATDAVLAANEFNDPPQDGNVYILVNVTATYNGANPEGESAWANVQFVSPNGNSYDSGDSFVVAPDSFDSLETLYQGASVTGNKVLEVPAADAAAGVLSVSPDLFTEKKFVAVQ